jgi:hypothetical protein
MQGGVGSAIAEGNRHEGSDGHGPIPASSTPSFGSFSSPSPY